MEEQLNKNLKKLLSGSGNKCLSLPPYNINNYYSSDNNILSPLKKIQTELGGWNIQLSLHRSKVILELLAGLEMHEVEHLANVLQELTKSRKKTARRVLLSAQYIGFTYPSMIKALFPDEGKSNISHKLEALSRTVGFLARSNHKDFKGETRDNFMFVVKTISNKGNVVQRWMRHKPKFYTLEDKYKSLIFRCISPTDDERYVLTNWRKFYERR